MDRTARIKRTTKETEVLIELNLDGTGQTEINTGVGFYDHMLQQIGKHGLLNLKVHTEGDLHIDAHHTVEDTAIALGEALRVALGDKLGVTRFGDATVPLDEVLVRAVVDLSGRPYVVYAGPTLPPSITGTGVPFPTSLVRHVWETIGQTARLTLHVDVLRAGRDWTSSPDAHHVIEAQCKAVARALRTAIAPDPRVVGVPSTKGTL